MSKREIIESLVKRLNELTGNDPVSWRRVDGRNVATIGTFVVDHNIGGYCIEQIGNESGGVSCPFGYDRYTGPAFIRHLHTLIAAVQLKHKAS